MNLTVISRVSTAITFALVALQIWDVYDDDLSAPWVVPAILACVAVTLVSLAVTRAGSRSPTNFTVVS
ncbi:MAG: hypothetical protein ACRCSN_07115, partial [Dermatophilaceae bacterium]